MSTVSTLEAEAVIIEKPAQVIEVDKLQVIEEVFIFLSDHPSPFEHR